MENKNSKYETVIGLEVHVQLLTKTKAFCACSILFGKEPNTQVCPVCLGLPGVLPVLNKVFFEYALKTAIALNCDIQKIVKFDRKNYYYPDLPKNYQISQYDMPLAYKGKLSVTMDDGQERVIGITRVHLEEDAGKLMHDTALPYSYVDLNRTGTPLLEIVSEPDIRTPEEAYWYLVTLKQIIKYLGVSDCNMEEGSLRCDANISLRRRGETKLGSKVEIKNLNSFKAVRDALLFEEERQEIVLEESKTINKETRLWNAEKCVTRPMRSKEEAEDYRYFPEPDLVPFEIEKDFIEKIRALIPELPEDKMKRFKEQYGFNEKDIKVLTLDREIADYFEKVARLSEDSVNALNWMKGEVMMHLNERAIEINALGLKPENLAEIIKMTKDAIISHSAAKDILRICIDEKKSPREIARERSLEQVSDESAIKKIVLDVIKANQKSVNDYLGGKENALGFLVGQVMKLSKGKANPKLANDLLRAELTRKN
ncbi:aspartyl-tRNA(Asn)/glutamyl-tRNA (Gln) amidotransferase subunit B [Candidatus Omnitrophus magneticus]|uniref:Aspartyl/glutamyl-tRNA(Asn/Gln) amidotransferase subunit B n=1 Tax=Candidatus Omnitrophus magneticus TaxID=1609969 RepID=A0A0F0CKT8_9BACT|nr:aspartyl-tRNA(Asn)/glutamyl-tRNA (Gln) amidotransferase subunit B [Candidatus Omnitrophus magneticus]